MNLKYIRNISETTADIYLYEEIGGWGVNATEFLNELRFLTDSLGLNNINIRINSPGGSVLEGFGIYSAIKNSRANINTYIDGIAASIAGLIAMAGDNVYMVDWGKLMLHSPHVDGAPVDENTRKALESIQESLVMIFSQKTKMSSDEIDDIMNEETWFNASDALEKGFIDEVYSQIPQNKMQLAEILNKIKTKQNNKMENLLNHLGLTSEDNEETAIEKIKELENNVAEHTTKVDDISNELATKQAELEEMKAQIAAYKNKEIEAYVDEAIEAGKYDSNDKERVLELAVNSFDSFKELTDAMKIGHVSIKDQLEDTPAVESRDNWTLEMWLENDAKGFDKLKADNVELYNTLCKQAIEVEEKAE